MGAALSRKILKRRPGPTGMSASATPISDEMENPPKRRKCQTVLSSSATSISDEQVVTEILLRLPVRPVLRFRSVSKSWRSMIDSPEFIRRHTEQSGPDSRDSKIIIAESSNLYSIHNLDSKEGARAKIMNSPLKNSNCFMVGSARGILCLGYSSGTMDEARQFMIWNPSTSKGDYPIRVVESNSIELNGNDDRLEAVYGFGYDHLKSDYILVRIISKEVTEIYDLEVLRDTGENYGFQLEIYSFRSNSWKMIMKYKDGRFPYYYNFGCDIVFVDGVNAIHFLVAENRESLEDHSSSIARSDLGTKSFSLLPMPERGTSITGLTSLEGRLCCSQNNPDQYGTTDVWVMKDYGITESWAKLVSIACNSSLAVDLLPIGYSQNGKKLLLASDDYEEKQKYLQCYDLENRYLERVTISGLPTLQGKIKGCVCSVSLVSI